MDIDIWIYVYVHVSACGVFVSILFFLKQLNFCTLPQTLLSYLEKNNPRKGLVIVYLDKFTCGHWTILVLGVL